MATYSHYRSDQEWMEIITACRQSGLSDFHWCRINGIPSSSFYNAARRLRRKACELTPAVKPGSTSQGRRQDVVKVDLVADDQTMPIQPVTTALPVAEPAKHIDKAHTIEIVLPGMSVLISNQADPALLAALMSAIR